MGGKLVYKIIPGINGWPLFWYVKLFFGKIQLI